MFYNLAAEKTDIGDGRVTQSLCKDSPKVHQASIPFHHGPVMPFRQQKCILKDADHVISM